MENSAKLGGRWIPHLNEIKLQRRVVLGLGLSLVSKDRHHLRERESPVGHNLWLCLTGAVFL